MPRSDMGVIDYFYVVHISFYLEKNGFKQAQADEQAIISIISY